MPCSAIFSFAYLLQLCTTRAILWFKILFLTAKNIAKEAPMHFDLLKPPTYPFKNLLQNPSYDASEVVVVVVHKIRGSLSLEALKLRKGRSGIDSKNTTLERVDFNLQLL